MAAKRNKSQAKRNGGGNGSMPGWAWLILGLALGIGVFLIAPKFIGGDQGFFRPKPNADAQPPALDATDRDGDGEPIVGDDDAANPPKTGTTTPTEEPDYAFYNLLSGEETPVSDAELAAKARAEEERAAKAREAAEKAAAEAAKNDDAKQNADTATTAPDTAKPTDPPPAIDTRNDGRDSADARTDPAPAAGDARYLLQAGAFAASGDAEALKAKIAFLGLSARVESAQIKGSTVYRVRMGPYGSATELAEAKRKLAGGGLPALAIKAK